MGALKDASIRALQRQVEAHEANSTQDAAEPAKDLQGLFAEYIHAQGARERGKILKDFAAHRIAFAEYWRDNPELLTAELQRAMLQAAVGGTYTDTETTVDARGRQRQRKTVKHRPPNIVALERLLDGIERQDLPDDGFLAAMAEAGGQIWQK